MGLTTTLRRPQMERLDHIAICKLINGEGGGSGGRKIIGIPGIGGNCQYSRMFIFTGRD
jgi:hypothetical protein